MWKFLVILVVINFMPELICLKRNSKPSKPSGDMFELERVLILSETVKVNESLSE